VAKAPDLKSRGKTDLLKVGLTGGIAAGKSTVGEMFVALGVHLIAADEIAHLLMRPGQEVYRQVVNQFGREILNPNGTINRTRLAEAAFGTSPSGSSAKPPRIKQLNQIVHPAVIRYHDEWMEQVGRHEAGAIAMVEAALLLEADAGKSFDRLLVVTCRPEQRIERWARRRHIDEESARTEVTRRMAAQLPDEDKIRRADFVIDNSGSLDATRQQVGRIYRQLQKQGPAGQL
jgi:dephospho-CoA kinase